MTATGLNTPRSTNMNLTHIKTTMEERFDKEFGLIWKELCEEWGNPPKAELRKYMKSLFASEISLAVAKERERIAGEIEKKRIDLKKKYKELKTPKDGSKRDNGFNSALSSVLSLIREPIKHLENKV